MIAIDQLLAAFPGCMTVAVVCTWFFFDRRTACQIYPSTTYINSGSVEHLSGTAQRRPLALLGSDEISSVYPDSAT